MSYIKPGNKYGDVRKQAMAETVSDNANPSGLTHSTIEALNERFEKFLPGLANKHGAVQNLMSNILPEGASWDSRGFGKTSQQHGSAGWGGHGGPAGGYGGMGGSMVSPQKPYQPEFGSSDRQQYPVHRILANRYWRLFTKLDPYIGTCIDMYGSMPWSDFQLTGEGVTGEVKEHYEVMLKEINVISTLESMVKEFLGVGEACPHAFWDENRGMWTHVSLHNPDQLEVISTPFIKMEPVVEFIPDDRLRAVLTSNNRLLGKVREQMPPELIAKLVARQNIPLSPINFTFIPRKMHPYDTRGTSIISRMWRVLMFEDAVFEASLQTARRMAAPLKLLKMGNPTTGWIPGPEHERKMLEMLAQAEVDPMAWIVTHYGVQTELVGVQERVMNITGHINTIEQYKLVAMGINKGFLTGDTNYASSITGLSVFMQRMKSMRNFFVNGWLIPKIFKPMAQMNGWIKPSKKELAGRYRVKRSAREIEQENRWIIPGIQWEKQLDSTVNTELVNVMNILEGQLGLKFSKTTKFAAAGKHFEEETKKIIEETKYEQSLQQYLPASAIDGGPGATGGGMSAPSPTPTDGGESEEGKPAEEGEAGGAAGNPGGAPGPAADKTSEEHGPSGTRDEYVRHMKSDLWDKNGQYKNWRASEVHELMNLLESGETKSPIWEELKSPNLVSAIEDCDTWSTLDCVETFLADKGYPHADFTSLRRILDAEGVLKDISIGKSQVNRSLLEDMPEDAGVYGDEDMNARVMNKGKQVFKTHESVDLLVGHGNGGDSRWVGDISDLLDDK